MLDMTEADYRREEYENTRYESALASLINDLIAAGRINLDDLVTDELANGDF
jgi:hypothetical protein